MITSYFTDDQLESAKTVSNKYLNELFQEVRSKDDRFYLQESCVTITGWFKKPVKIAVYTLLFKANGNECQVINFSNDNGSEINCNVPASGIYAFFYGFLNGVKHSTTK